MKTISFTTDYPFDLNVKSVSWTDLTVAPKMISYVGNKSATGTLSENGRRGFNKQCGVQYEPHHGFTVHFIVCIYISTILNKHLSASICVLKDETHTHILAHLHGINRCRKIML